MAAASFAGLPFAKMHGAGNDFIMVDERSLSARPALDQAAIAALCQRRTGIGADGLIVVGRDHTADLRMHYHNADGGRAAMCGNGARCTVAFAYRRGLSGSAGTLATDAGVLAFQVHGAADIEVQLPPFRDLELNLDLAAGSAPSAHACNTGVPHLVLPVADLGAIDVAARGPELRRHRRFGPQGVNVNWISPAPEPGVWRLRTYERGVEAETLACGTGAAAAAVILVSLQQAVSPVAIRTSNGDLLRITVDLAGGRLALRGPAILTFEGEVPGDA